MCCSVLQWNRHGYVLQCVAVCCSVLQLNRHWYVLQCVAVFCSETCAARHGNVLQQVVVTVTPTERVMGMRCSVLQCAVVCGSVLQWHPHSVLWISVAVCCSVLQCATVCCSHTYGTHHGCVLKCVAVCCSVLKCVAVCCSVLQWSLLCASWASANKLLWDVTHSYVWRNFWPMTHDSRHSYD